NIRTFAWDGHRNDVSGALTTVWDDGGRHFFAKDWPGVAMAAEYSWNPNRSKRDVMHRYSSIFYQDHQGDFPAMLSTLHEVGNLDRTANMLNAILQINYFSDTGTVCIDTSEFDQIQSILHRAGYHLEALLVKKDGKEDAYNAWMDLDYWRLSIKLLNSSIELGQQLLAFSSHYHNVRMQNMDAAHRKELSDLNSGVRDLAVKWKRLRSDFLDLWLRENRSDWLKEALLLFNQNISGLENLEEKMKALDPAGLPPDPPFLSYIATDDFYFSYWLGAGPFEVLDEESSTDFLFRNGGEHTIEPSAVAYYYDQNDQQVGFKKLISIRPDRVMFGDFFQPKSISTGYAYARLEAPRDMTVSVSIRCPGNLTVFCNGSIAVKDLSIGGWVQEKKLSLKLKQGRNHLMLKVSSATRANWGFSWKLLDHPATHHKHKYYLP
ncbi:MAG: hypothetical protein OEQ53_19835, partial [Saprospiraceae bacterium]|nr:hypothetical protein [Saprospiraceae bacterium]